MNHLAAFLLRLAAQASIHHLRWPSTPAPVVAFACFRLLDAADRYDSWIPFEPPTWISAINAPGGEA